jgi:hypothetical protein
MYFQPAPDEAESSSSRVDSFIIGKETRRPLGGKLGGSPMSAHYQEPTAVVRAAATPRTD